MKIEEHEKAYEEHKRNIDKAIEEGIEENQRNIGFNASQGSVELFAIFLHRLNLLQSSGDQFDHRVFKSDNLVKKKVPVDFPSRRRVLDLMRSIEKERTPLCYGSRKTKERVGNVIRNFNELRKVTNKELNRGLKNAQKK